MNFDLPIAKAICTVGTNWDKFIPQAENQFNCRLSGYSENYCVDLDQLRRFGQPINTVSNLSMILVPIYFLIIMKRISSTQLINLALLCVTGICSLLFHGMQNHIANQMDVFAMTLAANMGAFALLDMNYYRWFVQWPAKPWYKFYTAIKFITLCVCILAFVTAQALRTSNGLDIDIDSNYFIIIPLITVLIAIILAMTFSYREEIWGNANLLFSSWFIIVMFVWTAIVRLELSEPSSFNNYPMQFFHGHAVWHVNIGWIFMHVFSIMFYLYLDRTGKDPQFKSYFVCKCCTCKGCCGLFFPYFIYEDDEELYTFPQQV